MNDQDRKYAAECICTVIKTLREIPMTCDQARMVFDGLDTAIDILIDEEEFIDITADTLDGTKGIVRVKKGDLEDRYGRRY